VVNKDYHNPSGYTQDRPACTISLVLMRFISHVEYLQLHVKHYTQCFSVSFDRIIRPTSATDFLLLTLCLSVCLSVCLYLSVSLSRITQKVFDKFC